MTRRSAAFLLVWLGSTSFSAGAEPDRARPPQITVSGRGTVAVAPDHAAVSVGVTARAATAAAALDETSAAAAKIVEAARASGIDARDIVTSQISLQQQYRTVRDGGGGSSQQPDGFGATNSVEIRVRDFSRLGEFLRRGVGDGANRLGGITFGRSDRAGAERDALAAAVADARARAATAAEAAGVRLGQIEEIRIGTGGALPPTPQMRMEVRAAPPPVPVEPGELEVTASVEVTWRLVSP